MSLVKEVRKTLRPLKAIWGRAAVKSRELPHLFGQPQRGAAEWLIRSEVSYGGFVTGVARKKVSRLDRRRTEDLAFGGMTGGDRMLHHGYAKTYARYLKPFLNHKPLVLAEFGILKGTGLAIWCDLFPDARVVGFDIDLGHFEDNRPHLERRGAFRLNRPEVHEYDQLIEGGPILERVLGPQTLDVVMDDGLHSLESIVLNWRSVKPFLSPTFVYFIEDYANLLDECGDEFSGYETFGEGGMTVVFRNATP